MCMSLCCQTSQMCRVANETTRTSTLIFPFLYRECDCLLNHTELFLFSSLQVGQLGNCYSARFDPVQCMCACVLAAAP